MALGQLQHLETLFVKTGWLSTKCEAFNTVNAQDIANGTRFKQGPNLYALDTLVVTPMTKPGSSEAREVDRQKTIAEATGMSSFSELVNPFGLILHCFVSHFWGHDFSSTVTALELWAAGHHQTMTSEKESLVFWICLFALNQHKKAEEVGQNPQQGPFNAALAQATGGAVMVLDEQINPFKRIWCLFEIYRLKHLKKPFELICSEGSLSRPETCQNQAVSTEMLQATCEALWTVSAAKAQSSVAADKYQIWAEVADTSLKGAIGECQSAAKCCLYGAQVDSAQVVAISNSFTQGSELKAWLSEMLLKVEEPSVSMAKLLLDLGADVGATKQNGATALMLAAQGGHVDVAKLLLEQGADVTAATPHGTTALMAAALCGYVDVSKLLLEQGADVRAAMQDGTTALMLAAQGGYEDVSMLLLEQGADVRAAMQDGTTALMLAAQGGYVDVSKLLLDQGADVRAARQDGTTALMCAAQCGHVDVCKLLLENGADVRTAWQNGHTALMLAAQCGHVDVSRLLLENGADVTAATQNGHTALMLAAQCGHVDVCRLLLEHGADVRAAMQDGFTALMLAAQGGYVDVSKLLLENGADVKAATPNGITALMLARGQGHEAVARLIHEHV
eukprot:s416_g48.t1